jgi:hypothetical protein
MTRLEVWHYDPQSGLGERVWLDAATARRLVEHERNAGRVASIVPPSPKAKTYR